MGGKGEWSEDKKKSALAPGVQKLSDDWMAVAEGCVDEYAFEAEIAAAEALEPWNIAEAKGCPDWVLCGKAIEEELKALKDTGTWELVEMPKNANVVGSK